MGAGFQGLRAVARVLILSARGELLLCRSRDGKAWVPPGGTLDWGETLAVAACREAREEAGLEVDLGPLVYLQEFRPKRRPEHVIEVAFVARAREDRPRQETGATPLGAADRPWAAWTLQDMDGPVREVRWFRPEDVAKLAEPVYPAYLRDRFWLEKRATADPYLGLVQER
ncbi:MAG TPA: NUDIX hydrolase [Symbiobacteriaceae bacterium]|nr:NUDIX hydrolase [Symbiobacteriaceae bacterium]